MPSAPDLSAAFGLPPKEAVAWFEAKGYKITWDWHEMRDEAHAQAFTVAKAARLDILTDIRAGIEAALKEGRSERQFIRDLTPILQKKGWWGKAHDPETGEVILDAKGRRIRQGSPRRLSTIYRTNVQSAYMAGRWKAAEAAKRTHPYLQYVAVMDSRTRPTHAAMNGRAFAVDDPIWHTHYPPNGYNCRCRTRPMTRRALEREGVALSSSEGRLSQVEWPVSLRDPEAGSTLVTVYKGPDMRRGFAPDVGFNSNPGRHGWGMPEPLDGQPDTTPLLRKPLCFACPVAPPAPRPWRGESLETGREDEYYVRAFLRRFDADIGKPALFDDVADEPLWISDALFLDRKKTGKAGAPVYKVQKNGREAHLVMLADTLIRPHEIWDSVEWHNALNKTVLRRRYLAWWTLEGREQPGLSVFEHGLEGWLGVTTFDEGQSDPDYLARVRAGILKWRVK
jgi:SPP1 gp7 family putative phage head morphogenesis protein